MCSLPASKGCHFFVGDSELVAITIAAKTAAITANTTAATTARLANLHNSLAQQADSKRTKISARLTALPT